MSDEEASDLVDEHTQDCVDYAATVLQEAFPDLKLEIFEVTEWRKGIKAVIPPQFEDRAEVEGAIRTLRDLLFWNKDVLVAYSIEGQNEE